MRTDTWRLVGGFDPEFFLWYEDIDLAKRLVNEGFRNVVVQAARAQHEGAHSLGGVDRVDRQAVRLRSLLRYASKHHRPMLPLLRLSVLGAALVRGLQIGGLQGARELIVRVHRCEHAALER
jgi:N-acetylglucosaminyl-diphospho-decaprenol L-rhamnosyltransferase